MLSINQCYLDFVNKILKEGKETYKDSNHHLKESLGNFQIIDDPLDLKFRAKYQNYTTDMMLTDIKSGRFDIEGCPIKSDALYEYVRSVEDPEIINNTQGFGFFNGILIFGHHGNAPLPMLHHLTDCRLIGRKGCVCLGSILKGIAPAYQQYYRRKQNQKHTLFHCFTSPLIITKANRQSQGGKTLKMQKSPPVWAETFIF